MLKTFLGAANAFLKHKNKRDTWRNAIFEE